MPPAVANPPLTSAASSDAPLDALLALYRERVKEGDYVLIGRLSLIHTVSRGVIDFRRTGPLVGKLTDRADLVIASQWPLRLPPLDRLLEEQCPACAVKCEQCRGEKQSLCQVCGGAGKIQGLRSACPECTARLGHFSPECPKCKGRGEVQQYDACRGCAGRGKTRCCRCGGSGTEGSGRIKGSSCPDCHGQGRKIETRDQPLTKFAHGTMGGMVALGPIRSLVLHSVEGPARIEIVDVTPDRDGNMMVALLDFSRHDAAEAYLVGGLPTVRRRAVG